MTYRLMLSILITLCGALTGMEIRRRMVVRIRSLQMIRDLFREMKACVSHTDLGLREIAIKLSGSGILQKNSPEFRDNLSHSSFSKSFVMLLHDSKNALCLTEEDIDIVSSLVAKLGYYTLDGLLSQLSLADDTLASRIEAASQKAASDGKIALVLGFSCGAVAALLLF